MELGPTATKKTVLEQLLEQGMVLVALDARVHAVDVPNHLTKDPQLRLNLSYRFGLPMSVEDWGVAATLTFAGVPYSCRFPWAAIFLMVSHVSGQPYLFPDDIPAELLSQAPDMAASMLSNTGREPPKRPKLVLVDGSSTSTAPGAGAPSTAEATAAAPRGKPRPQVVSAPSPVPEPDKADAPAPGDAAPRRTAMGRDRTKGAERLRNTAPATKRKTPAVDDDLRGPGDAAADTDAGRHAPKDDGPPPTPRRHGHLRVVK